MKKLLIALCLLPAIALADGTNGTKTVTAAATTTVVEAANDVNPPGRNYIFLQNLSASIVVNCTIGVSAGATTATGISLATGASYTAFSVTGPNGHATGVPNGEIDCIAASSTAPVVVITY